VNIFLCVCKHFKAYPFCNYKKFSPFFLWSAVFLCESVGMLFILLAMSPAGRNSYTYWWICINKFLLIFHYLYLIINKANSSPLARTALMARVMFFPKVLTHLSLKLSRWSTLIELLLYIYIYLRICIYRWYIPLYIFFGDTHGLHKISALLRSWTTF